MNKVDLTVENQVATLTINNSPVNALSQTVITELLKYLTDIANDDNVRVVLITGAGKRAFSAGDDIKELPSLLKVKDKEAATEFTKQLHKMINTLANLPKPTVAVINGVALGGGCEIALACDLRIASDKSQIGLPEIKIGVHPGGGGTQRLPRLIGISKAKEMMFLGAPITAKEAYRIGLVNFLVSEDELPKMATEIASRVVELPGLTLKLLKDTIDRGAEMTIDQGLQLEVDSTGRLLLTEDAREGIGAFIEKRAPQFKHR